MIPLDDEVDESYHYAVKSLVKEMRNDEDLIAPLIHVQTIAKWLEYIGDHCTNLAEDIVYMVHG